MENKILKNMLTYILLSVFLYTILGFVNIPENIVFDFIANIVLYSLIILAIYFINRKEINEMFLLYKRNWRKNLKKNIIIWIIGFLFMMASNYLITVILNNDIPVNEQIVRDLFQKYLFLSIITNVICAPVLEEFIFRLSFNEINNKYLYLISSSLIFSLFHTLGSTSNFSDLIYILPYFSLGLAFAVVYYKSKNIFDSILIHALHNAVVLGLYFII